MLEDKIAEAMIDVGKNVADDIVRPTSKSIGENLGLLVDGVMGWLGYWGQKQEIKRAVYLEDYKRRISEKISDIAEEKLQEPEIRVVGPAIEASKFYIEEEKFREMFAEMVASACRTDTAGKVHPAFPEMIKQLSLLDVQILELFMQSGTFPCVEFYAKIEGSRIRPFPYLLIDFKDCSCSFSYEEELSFAECVDNMIRLGLLQKNSNVLELNFDYNKFNNHWLYEAIKKTLPENSQIHMRQFRIEPTNLGRTFIECCFNVTYFNNNKITAP